MSLDDLDPYDGANHFDQLDARQMEAARLLYEAGCETWPAEVAAYVEAIETHAGMGTLPQWCREARRREAVAYEAGHPGVVFEDPLRDDGPTLYNPRLMRPWRPT